MSAYVEDTEIAQNVLGMIRPLLVTSVSSVNSVWYWDHRKLAFSWVQWSWYVTQTKMRSCFEGFTVWCKDSYLERWRAINSIVDLQGIFSPFLFKCFDINLLKAIQQIVWKFLRKVLDHVRGVFKEKVIWNGTFDSNLRHSSKMVNFTFSMTCNRP